MGASPFWGSSPDLSSSRDEGVSGAFGVDCGEARVNLFRFGTISAGLETSMTKIFGSVRLRAHSEEAGLGHGLVSRAFPKPENEDWRLSNRTEPKIFVIRSLELSKIVPN